MNYIMHDDNLQGNYNIIWCVLCTEYRNKYIIDMNNYIILYYD